MNDITIVDYKRGNLYSIAMAVKYAGGNPIVTSDPAKIRNAEKLILAGVGAFGDAMDTLCENNLSEAIIEFISKGKHLLGICLGMQLLFSESYEFGCHKGLGLINGKVVRFNESNDLANRLKIPHIAWCSIEKTYQRTGTAYKEKRWSDLIFHGINSGTDFYFAHSFVCVPENNDDILAESVYGSSRFCSAAGRNNICGCQFHPEKSGVNGLKIYENFIYA